MLRKFRTYVALPATQNTTDDNDDNYNNNNKRVLCKIKIWLHLLWMLIATGL